MNRLLIATWLIPIAGGCDPKATRDVRTSLIVDNTAENAGTESGVGRSKVDFESLMNKAKSALQDDRRVRRVPALSAACKIADKNQAEQILDLVIEFEVYPLLNSGVDELEIPVPRTYPLRKAPTKWSAHFVQHDVEYLLPVLSDHARLFYMLAHLFAFNSGCESALQKMAECNVPQSLKNKTALKILDAGRGWHRRFEDGMWNMISEDVLNILRRRVQTPSTPREFYVTAADFLSQFGDEDILPVLKAGAHGYSGLGPTAGSRLSRFIWRIEVQHPPTKLLEYMSSSEMTGFREWRDWAVRRAHSLGLDKSLIRKAILEHAQRANTQNERVDLPMLKKVGLDLDILKAGDLPDIDLSIYDRHRIVD